MRHWLEHLTWLFSRKSLLWEEKDLKFLFSVSTHLIGRHVFQQDGRRSLVRRKQNGCSDVTTKPRIGLSYLENLTCAFKFENLVSRKIWEVTWMTDKNWQKKNKIQRQELVTTSQLVKKKKKRILSAPPKTEKNLYLENLNGILPLSSHHWSNLAFLFYSQSNFSQADSFSIVFQRLSRFIFNCLTAKTIYSSFFVKVSFFFNFYAVESFLDALICFFIREFDNGIELVRSSLGPT